MRHVLPFIGRGAASAAVAYRYWRIFVQTNNGDTSYISIGEIELRGTIGGSDFTTPSTPLIVSSEAGGTTKASAVDNVLDNLSWISTYGAITNEWIRLDLGSATAVAQVAMYVPSYGASRAPKDFIIQGSDDGTTFTDVKSFTDVTGWTSTVRTFDL